MKEDQWAAHLREKQPEMKMEQAKVDETEFGRFQEAMTEFLTSRWKGERRDDLFSGRPFLNDEKGRHEFRLQDVMRQLDRDGMRGVTRHQVGVWITEDGGHQPRERHHQAGPAAANMGTAGGGG